MERTCAWSITKDPALDSRGHFFAAAAEAMRRILVERARKKKALSPRRRATGGHVYRRDRRGLRLKGFTVMA